MMQMSSKFERRSVARTLRPQANVTIQNGTAGDTHDRSRAWLEALASDTGFPLDVVEQLYDAEHRRLVAQARIVEFVPVLAANNVRKQLRALFVRRAA